jgi:hypothetical protein
MRQSGQKQIRSLATAVSSRSGGESLCGSGDLLSSTNDKPRRHRVSRFLERLTGGIPTDLRD